ncbi:MAG: transporter substrate-binding domain-containing protein [Hyphomicrobiales bacterium]|nr:transporter substrate-binding domain-containing protein [Hyphomicrobiales bacterium]
MQKIYERLVVRIACALMVICAGSTFAHAQETAPDASQWRNETIGPRPDWSWLGSLRFATDANYPPFNYRDQDGQLTGFNVDLAKAICDELIVQCDVNPLDWEQLLPTLAENQVDAVIASVAISQANLELAEFTDSYYATPAKFVVRSGASIIDVKPENLEGQTIAVTKDTAHEAYLRDFFPGAEIMTFETDAAARDALREEKVELLFGDAISLMFWINGADSARCCQFRGRGFLEARYFGEGVGIAVAKGDIRLKEVLNYALVRVRASGKLEELLLRYFPLAIY